MRLPDPGLRRRHGDAAGAARREDRALGRHVDGRPDRHGRWRRCPARRSSASCSTTSARRSTPPASRASRELRRRAADLGSAEDEAADYLLTISQGFGPHSREQWLALTRPMLRRVGSRLPPPLRPGDRRLAAAAHAGGGRRRRGRALGRLRRDPLPDAAPARRDVRRAVARHGRGDGAARPARRACTSSAASAMRRRWSMPARSRWCGSSCSGHEDRLDGRARRRRTDRSPARGLGRGRRRRTRCRAPAPSPRRCCRAASCRPARACSRTPTARRRSSPRSARRRRCCAAAYLVYAADQLGKPDEVLTPLFGASQVELVVACAQARRAAAHGAGRARSTPPSAARQVERVRKMLLAFSRDLRVVLLRLASRLQTLRCHAASKRPCPQSIARRDAAGVRAARQPARHLADQVGARGPLVPLPRPRELPRDRRHARRAARRPRGAGRAPARRCSAPTSPRTACRREVQGRPKHLYSIWKKMERKGARLRRRHGRARAARHRARRRRLLCGARRACTSAGRRSPASSTTTSPGRRPTATARCTPWCRATTAGRSRSRSARAEMHEHAEFGVAAHWAYKERRSASRAVAGGALRGAHRAGAPGRAAPAAGLGARPRRRRRCPAPTRRRGKGSSTTASTSSRRRRRGRARRRARRRSTSPTPCTPISATAAAAPRSTARWCRSARAAERPDGRDHGGQERRAVARLAEPRARLPAERALEGQGARLVQRPGPDATDRARPRGGGEAAAARRPHRAQARATWRRSSAFAAPTRCSRWSARTSSRCATSRRCCGRRPSPEAGRATRSRSAAARAEAGRGGVLVVGVESLLTSLARCCRPAPPDAIAGYVTRGRASPCTAPRCSNLRALRAARRSA